MQTVARSNFTTVKTEGAILPVDLLQRIADGELDGLQPEAYHLAPTERPNEAINRAWNRCLAVWRSFNEQRQNLAGSDSGTSLTRERWLLILFQELGYGRLPFQRRIEVADGSVYPISHVWGQTPIHLVSFRQALDERDSTVKRSPHSLMQECLNRSDDHLWGFVSNGLILRVLRDNISLTRAAYLEFDLEMMMTGEIYADFSLLWLVCHQSRVEIGSQPDAPALPSNCWLERWSQAAAEQGTRALDALRDGVQETIEALGRGFLAHRANAELRRQLNSGDLTAQDYYRQLLRLVYRLIFLFVAEDRDLLLVKETPAETQGSRGTDEGQKSPRPPGSSAPQLSLRQRYMEYYSVSRLRRLAEGRRGGPHPDLYRTLRRVCFLLREGYQPLGLPALGSFLFSDRSTPALDEADLANTDLLNAIRALAFTIEGRVRRPVDYKNLGAEELGSVYESLLELHPQLNIAAATFDLATAAGSERKTTGSYYTPSSLINSLLDTALEPVVEDRLRQAEEQRSRGAGEKDSPLLPRPPAPLPGKVSPQETAILSIKVVDPAAGSGHFLIAAANRLATHLARIRTGDDEPSPAARRSALRDVVRHCIHGVDINEMAVELCKVALWMETLDPGKPLSFLEANIQCGNSLMGATPALLKAGIPDDAFKPITGDDKGYCKEWKARNKKERGQLVMDLEAQPWERLGDLATAMMALERMEGDTLAGVQAQESKYAELVRSTPYEYSRFWADTWCAAFVWLKQPEWNVGRNADTADKTLINADKNKKIISENLRASASSASHQKGFAYPITEATFRKIERNPHDVAIWMKEEIARLQGEYQFFHWHLAFPHVFSVPSQGEGVDNEQTGWNGGFDVVLGNPPWEKLQTEELQFFAVRAPEIASLSGAKRKKAIRQLEKSDPQLAKAWQEQKRFDAAMIDFIRNSGVYPLTGVGKFNSFALFAELSRRIQDDAGRAGVIVPSGIATDYTTRYFFQDIVETDSLRSLYDFENREGIFPAIDSRLKFCLLTLAGSSSQVDERAEFVFFAHKISDLQDTERRFTLSAEEIKLLNPNTFNCPIFRYRRDAEIVKAIYRRIPIFLDEQDPPRNKYEPRVWRLINTTDDSNEFVEQDSKINLNLIPVVEAKTIHQFDHRFATFTNGNNTSEVKSKRKNDPTYEVTHRHYIKEQYFRQRISEELAEKSWFLTIRNIARATDERTIISSIFPRGASCEHTPYIEIAQDARFAAYLLGVLNSFTFDYVARQKVGGTQISYFILYQLPTIYPSSSQIIPSKFFLKRIVELVFTTYSLSIFCKDCGYHGPPFRWDEERRFLLRCELDAAYFHLYDIERDDVDYIMETFPIVKRKDEAAFGEYRTKRVILEIYDEMAEAMRSGQSYQTRLDPPPADPRVAHPWDPAYGEPPEPGKEWKDEGGGRKDEKTAAVMAERREDYAVVAAPPDLDKTTEAEPLVLSHPEPEVKKSKKPKPAQVTQETFLEVMPTPTGPRAARLKRAMTLGQDHSPVATRELVAFLADEDDNIRWLAGSSLVQRADADTVAAIAAFLNQAEPKRVEQARSEALRVLGLIADTAEDESVRAGAREIIERR